jgi:hypothetical protein
MCHLKAVCVELFVPLGPETTVPSFELFAAIPDFNGAKTIGSSVYNLHDETRLLFQELSRIEARGVSLISGHAIPGNGKTDNYGHLALLIFGSFQNLVYLRRRRRRYAAPLIFRRYDSWHLASSGVCGGAFPGFASASTAPPGPADSADADQAG